MNRVIVLVLCLASAAGIAAYTYVSSERGEPTAVYVVAKRPAEPKPELRAAANIDPADRVGLTRALQRELKRVGCYGGEITGAWTTSSRMAMKAFTERVNATLPIDKPDPVLLSLVQGHRDRACDTACPAASGACVPDAVPAKAAPSAAGLSGPALAVPMAIPAPTGPVVRPGPQSKAGAADDAGAGPAKPAPPDGRARDQNAVADAARNGPVPPEGMREKRPRRSDNTASRPPKFVRDALKVLGF